MNERMRFVTDWERDLYSMVELCERYGVSRKTGYKWLARYEADGPDGLRERSRAPHQCPHRIAPEVGPHDLDVAGQVPDRGRRQAEVGQRRVAPADPEHGSPGRCLVHAGDGGGHDRRMAGDGIGNASP